MKNGADGGGCFPTGRHYPGIAHLLRAVAVGVAEELGPELAIDDLPLVALDTETTGRDASVDRIVEIACVQFRGGLVTERRSWLVNPGRPIPKEAFDVHGISDDDVRDKPSFAEVAAEVVAALQGAVPVAYNAEFDRAFLLAELERAGAPSGQLPPACRRGVDWIDPLVWARELQKFEKGKSLGDVTGRLGIEMANAHRATDDAEAAVRVLAAFLSNPRVPKTYAAFVQEQRRLARIFEEERARWKNARS
ncbi:MAG: 3'-5' exonuclease [Myxococcales bacterium]|nr:3'-5' exonuclease [Myxococcales bacterium]